MSPCTFRLRMCAPLILEFLIDSMALRAEVIFDTFAPLEAAGMEHVDGCVIIVSLHVKLLRNALRFCDIDAEELWRMGLAMIDGSCARSRIITNLVML